jgi:ribulose 1,5-bisphosphate synthetase/thiazole synthase
MQRLHAYSQAYMSIHIAVVGGGLAGLTTALALTRVGHHVTVFEQHAEDALLPSGGVQIPPNQSKILVRWGLKDALSKIAVTNTALRMYTCVFGTPYLPCGLADLKYHRLAGRVLREACVGQRRSGS